MTDSEMIRTASELLRSVCALSKLVTNESDRIKADMACIARDVSAALEDYTDECGRSQALLTALEDIALCRIPNVPDGVTVGMEQFSAFARDHAKAAVAAYDHEEPTPMMKAAKAMHDSLTASKP